MIKAILFRIHNQEQGRDVSVSETGVPFLVQRVEMTYWSICRLYFNRTEIRSALTIRESDDEIVARIGSRICYQGRAKILQKKFGEQFCPSNDDFRLRLRIVHRNTESVGLYRLLLQNRTTSSCRSFRFLPVNWYATGIRVIALTATPSWTERMNTRLDGSCTPKMYVGAGICSNPATSFLVEDIRRLLPGLVEAVAFAWTKKNGLLP